MKCPKCHYLGFETGDRCRNCGYDFSLLADPSAEPGYGDLALRDAPVIAPAIDLPLNQGTAWQDDAESPLEALTTSVMETAEPPESAAGPLAFDSTLAMTEERAGITNEGGPFADRPTTRLDDSSPSRPESAQGWEDPALPLFAPSANDEEDAPLVRLPAAPRPPLSVRRTTERPRLRAVARPAPVAIEPDLEFGEDAGSEGAALSPPAEAFRSTSRIWTAQSEVRAASGVRRLGAAIIDHALLLAIDAAVIYFTLRMIDAVPGDLARLPRVPLMLFLALIKLGYFGMFTAMGGQTIGKMAFRIRVVSEDGRALGATQSVNRTLAGILTVLTLGLGFLPGLFGEHRALHDRVARTRVVGLEPS